MFAKTGLVEKTVVSVSFEEFILGEGGFPYKNDGGLVPCGLVSVMWLKT